MVDVGDFDGGGDGVDGGDGEGVGCVPGEDWGGGLGGLFCWGWGEGRVGEGDVGGGWRERWGDEGKGTGRDGKGGWEKGGTKKRGQTLVAKLVGVGAGANNGVAGSAEKGLKGLVGANHFVGLRCGEAERWESCFVVVVIAGVKMLELSVLMRAGNGCRIEQGMQQLLYPLSAYIEFSSRSFNNMIPDLDWYCPDSPRLCRLPAVRW